MPHSPDKWKSYLADLGRPTKRGIRKCPKCGTVNGTRGNSCKNKACDVVFRDNGASKKTSTEACRIVANIPGLQVFSARLRDRGPDYRNFVQLPADQNRTVELGTTLPEEDELSLQSTKCYVDACIKSKEFPCSHIQAAYRCFSDSQPLSIKHTTIPSLSIPPDHQQTIAAFMNEPNGILVQRVSKTSFVVKCASTSKHPLGYLHIMFFKHNKDDEMSEKKFLCTCKSFKSQNRQNDLSNPQLPGPAEILEIDAKFCLHYHACLCAFASDDNLSTEFAYFLIQSSQTSTLLSQLHLVTLPTTATTTSVDGMDTGAISVEIMQDNISLLESITGVSDATLQNVQGLEGVLSDQIIVTNVDDSLSFGDTTGLEGLDDGDSQVCQIFASAQNAIHLANAQNTIQLSSAFTASVDGVHQTMNISPTSNILVPPSQVSISVGKKRRQESGDGVSVIDVGCLQTLAPQTQLYANHVTTATHFENISEKTVPFPQSSPPRGPSSKGATQTTLSTNMNTTQSASLGPIVSPAIVEPVNHMSEVFEFWLSGVNERLNAAMNFRFDGKPDPVVYYISSDYFDQLKERIICGVKKKRLPNQTVIVARTDKPPAGSFTKHVWKITNLIHVLQIFQNQIIPLKISQYFIKMSNGMFEEWISPNETDRKNQLIKPHLYSTYLKVGKLDPNSMEVVPFVIEWIPDILPQSKLGELTLIFEFGRHSPRDESVSSKIVKNAQMQQQQPHHHQM